jgi:hypothetical protein
MALAFAFTIGFNDTATQSPASSSPALPSVAALGKFGAGWMLASSWS